LQRSFRFISKQHKVVYEEVLCSMCNQDELSVLRRQCVVMCDQCVVVYGLKTQERPAKVWILFFCLIWLSCYESFFPFSNKRSVWQWQQKNSNAVTATAKSKIRKTRQWTQ